MIKELITDIAFDKITVAQALTRAKLIASQIKNETLKTWLSNELSGYEYDDAVLPDYRRIYSEILLTAQLPFGKTQEFPVILGDNIDKETKNLINIHRVFEPISIVESNIAAMEGHKGFVQLPGAMIQMVSEFYKNMLDQNRAHVISGGRWIGKSQLQNIVENTKQKLLDVLQELEDEFPNLDKNYTMNEANNEKAQNIITNNIYGNNNPLNVAAGEKINQGDINFKITNEHIEQLKSFGVNDEEIEELTIIDQSTPKGNPERKSKMMSWLGKVSSSIAARGIYDGAPKLIEYVGDLI